jgi:hypothetical protein
LNCRAVNAQPLLPKLNCGACSTLRETISSCAFSMVAADREIDGPARARAHTGYLPGRPTGKSLLDRVFDVSSPF